MWNLSPAVWRDFRGLDGDGGRPDLSVQAIHVYSVVHVPPISAARTTLTSAADPVTATAL
jgi:hypothetical protein